MVQNISNKEYEEIKKLCLFCFQKYFKKYSFLKEDLLQEGIIYVLKHLDIFDINKSKFSSFVVRYARYGMLYYLDITYKFTYKFGKGRKYIKFDYDLISLDTCLSSDSDSNLTLSDLLPDDKSDVMYSSILDKDCIKACIKNALLKCCSYKEKSLKTLYNYKKYYEYFSKKTYKQEKYAILCDYLKTLSVSDTAKKFGVSKQYVSQYKIDFAKYLKEELIKSGYYS